ncbi:50S ribosomal protein L15e [Candidatus Geothermarchaeota archaeon]|nr:MAG: 50S ribosomal protein L15e [Candidatus Geothermarchaeota archaeon]
MYKYISKTWREIWRNPEYRQIYQEKRIKWRREKSIQRIKKPSRLDRARALGYKAKPGYVVIRVRVSKGGLRKIPPTMGRRQKRTGVSKIKRQLSLQTIAENRAHKKYKNLEILGSYYVGEDGRYKWFEVIMVDPTIVKEKS